MRHISKTSAPASPERAGAYSFTNTTNGLTRVYTQELCINDTCVNEEQLKSLLSGTRCSRLAPGQ
jgi:hypothetical protein